jgi:uncharacterized membrane protein (TIGR02234 family)
LLLDLLGAAFALVFATRTWQTITVSREAPLRPLSLDLTGRKIDALPTALALVALAGVVAVLATRGVWRRAVGVLLVLAGAGVVASAVAHRGGVSATRAQDLLQAALPSVGPANDTIGIGAVSAAWWVLTLLSGVLIALAGVLVAVRGNRWAGMSAKYDRPAAAEAEQDAAKRNASLWSALVCARPRRRSD